MMGRVDHRSSTTDGSRKKKHPGLSLDDPGCFRTRHHRRHIPEDVTLSISGRGPLVLGRGHPVHDGLPWRGRVVLGEV